MNDILWLMNDAFLLFFQIKAIQKYLKYMKVPTFFLSCSYNSDLRFILFISDADLLEPEDDFFLQVKFIWVSSTFISFTH